MSIYSETSLPYSNSDCTFQQPREIVKVLKWPALKLLYCQTQGNITTHFPVLLKTWYRRKQLCCFKRNTIPYNDEEICLFPRLLRGCGWLIVGLYQIPFQHSLDDHRDFLIGNTYVMKTSIHRFPNISQTVG